MLAPDQEFDQCVAEAGVRIGKAAVLEYLEMCGRQFGWPIPIDKRPVVLHYLALLVRGTETVPPSP